jgi:hypothetical protein
MALNIPATLVIPAWTAKLIQRVERHEPVPRALDYFTDTPSDHDDYGIEKMSWRQRYELLSRYSVGYWGFLHRHSSPPLGSGHLSRDGLRFLKTMRKVEDIWELKQVLTGQPICDEEYDSSWDSSDNDMAYMEEYQRGFGEGWRDGWTDAAKMEYECDQEGIRPYNGCADAGFNDGWEAGYILAQETADLEAYEEAMSDIDNRGDNESVCSSVPSSLSSASSFYAGSDSADRPAFQQFVTAAGFEGR